MSEFQKSTQQWTKILSSLETAHQAALALDGVVGEDMAGRIERVLNAAGSYATAEMERLTAGGS